jgi:hypothetical protein
VIPVLALVDVVADLPLLLRVAGGVTLVVLLANLPILGLLELPHSLAGAPAIVRHVFWSHYAWVAATLLVFAGMDLAFPDALAGAHPLGRFVSGALAFLWSARLVAQRLFYEPAFLRAHRWADVAFTCAFFFLAAVHAVAAVAAPAAADLGR